MSTPKKAVLGRGLNALLPEHIGGDAADAPVSAETARARLYPFDERTRTVGRVAEIPVALISPNPYQPRQDFEETALEELADSIRQLGVIQPITVRAAGDGRFEIITGERRFRAAGRAGLARIPAYVREADTEEMLEMALVENVQREALNPIEVALGYQRLIDECGLTQEQVARKVGKNRVTVANLLRLLRLPPPVQASLRDGTVTAGHARALLALDDEADQVTVLREIEANDLSVRDVEDRVRALVQARQAPPAPPSPLATETPLTERDALQLGQFSDALRARLSTQIRIKHRGGDHGGRIEIAYYSDDDLERLMDLLLG